MIDLYTAPTPNGWKVSIALEEMGLPYKVVPIDLGKLVQKEEWYLALNPNGRIPTIVDREADEPACWSRSTLDRELRFIQSHTIHHFALIGWMLRALGVRIPEDFGLAPSTRSYWASLGRTP